MGLRSRRFTLQARIVVSYLFAEERGGEGGQGFSFTYRGPISHFCWKTREVLWRLLRDS